MSPSEMELALHPKCDVCKLALEKIIFRKNQNAPRIPVVTVEIKRVLSYDLN